jgi:CubicO group peptidase (beta-lactamase class C family)
VLGFALATACRPGPADSHARVAELLAAYDGDDRPGACVLVRQRGAVAYEGCVGMADLEAGRAVTPETNFRLASVTKQFTATAVLRLVSQGRLSLTTTLREVFPSFPPWADAVTVEQLLTHTAGLVDYEDVMPPGDAQILDDGVLQLLATQDSTYFPPGSAFRYSNSAYAVLARIVEERSGRPFGAFLETEIFAPLGMAATVARTEGTTVAHRAYGYSRQDDGSWVRTDQSRTSATLGDGGVYSSLRDLNRWFAVVEGRRMLLDSALAAAVFTEARTQDGRGVGYGFGWYVDSTAHGRRFRHDGTTIGFRHEVRRLPGDDLTVLLLSNRNELDTALADALVGLFREDAGPTSPAPPATDAAAGLRRDSLLRAAREIMETARYCALITVDSGGRLQARAIDAFPPDSGMVVRIGTNRRTRKVAEIARAPKVTLYYFDAPSASYVTLQGYAQVVTDPAETRRFWKPEWESFYPDRESDYVLIAVRPQRIELVSESRGIGGDPVTWRPPVVEFPGGRR